MTRPVAPALRPTAHLDVLLLLAVAAVLAGMVFWVAAALRPDAPPPPRDAPASTVKPRQADPERTCLCVVGARRLDHAL